VEGDSSRRREGEGVSMLVHSLEKLTAW
jgi:hypothetical protein